MSLGVSVKGYKAFLNIKIKYSAQIEQVGINNHQIIKFDMKINQKTIRLA
jgi:hypothetical protein